MIIQGPKEVVIIKPRHIKWLSKQKLNMNHVLILEEYMQYPTVPAPGIADLKEYKALRDRYMVDDKGITEAGKKLIEELCNIPDGPIVKVKLNSIVQLDEELEKQWQLFWDAYPRSAQFTYKGHEFNSERVLRAGEAVCKGKWLKIIKEDNIKPEVLLQCLKVEVATRMEESYNHFRKENKLHYMNGPEVWLNQKKYQGYIDREMPEGWGKQEKSMFTEA